MKWLLVSCLLLHEVSRVVLQATPQKVERVTVQEWCTYQWGTKLEQNTYVLVEDHKTGNAVESKVLWPCDPSSSSSGCC